MRPRLIHLASFTPDHEIPNGASTTDGLRKNNEMFSGNLCPLLLATAFLLVSTPLRAQDHHHHHDEGAESDHHHGLHFAHPLIGESITPDTKVRLEHEYEHFRHEEGDGQTVALEGEYAFDPSFSIEVEVPVGIVNPEGGPRESALGNTGVAFKLTNRAFVEQGVLLGYGIEFGLPTGNDDKRIGSDHIVTYEPFLDGGYKKDALEVSAFARFGIPTRQREGEEVETELEYNVSSLYHVNSQVQGLFEIDGSRTLSGEETESLVFVTPGVKYRPIADGHLIVGFGVRVPLSDASESDVGTHFSAFYHF